MHRGAPFWLSFLAGVLFSNPVYADMPPFEALTGQTKTVDSGTFPITSNPFPAILFANGGTITTTPRCLPLTSEYRPPALQRREPAQLPLITLPSPGIPGASTGASVDSGGTISIRNSTLNVT